MHIYNMEQEEDLKLYFALIYKANSSKFISSKWSEILPNFASCVITRIVNHTSIVVSVNTSPAVP